MNIIIEPDQVDTFKQKYTVLELDTIRIMPDSKQVTAYCVVENIPITELPTVESKMALHQHLMENYRKKDWNYCEQALEHLLGSWNGELDSFYVEIQTRITKYKEQDPGDEWDGVIEKNTAS